MEPSNFICGRSIRTMGVTVDGKSKTDRTKVSETAEVAKKAKVAKQPVTKHEAEPSTPVFENPLVPHGVLREMYRKLVEIRLLGEYAMKQAQGKKQSVALDWPSGQEACRVSVTQGLEGGDLVLDAQPGGLTGYLLGSELRVVVSELRPAKGKNMAAAETKRSRLLPFVQDGETRLFAGLGVAILAKQMQRTDAVVIFMAHHEVSNGTWKRALTLAAKEQLSVIFMVLPKSGKAKPKLGPSGMAERCGVPGIPVDASDTVALYRVTQESVGRIRAGGGAVLIEGVSFPAGTPGKHKAEAIDPIVQMKGYLQQRQVATDEWMAGVEAVFRKQLASLRR